MPQDEITGTLALLKRNSFTAREADDIANLAFIGGKTNQQISDKSPADYFPPLIQKSGLSPFAAQCIPMEDGRLAIDQYKEFLTARRSLVAERLNLFLSAPPTIG